MTRHNMNTSIIPATRHITIVISENIIKERIRSQRTYLGFEGEGTLTINSCSGADGVTTVLQTHKAALKTTVRRST